MNIVLLTHPEFLGLRSQSHFACMLLDAYRQRGHRVELRRPKARLRRLIDRAPLAKWAGYIDQYLVFPGELRRAARSDPPDTLYVFCDQALGPWVPGLAHRPHVVHCHDLLALRSALGEIPENPTSATGRLYQRYIRRGFRHARHFISISQKTRDDLHRCGCVEPHLSEVVYNGLNYPYAPMAPDAARQILAASNREVPDGEFVLHVGAGQWYKNSVGVVAIYRALVEHRLANNRPVPALVMVSSPPDALLSRHLAALPPQARVHFCGSVDSRSLQALYSAAGVMLFPSHAEGFGWPIVEAMACGCPVVTTGEAPMTEVGGPHATYLSRLQPGQDLGGWGREGAMQVDDLLCRPGAVRDIESRQRIEWTSRFSAEAAISGYLDHYQQILRHEGGSSTWR